MAAEDTEVVPKESEWFGYFQDGSRNEVGVPCLRLRCAGRISVAHTFDCFGWLWGEQGDMLGLRSRVCVQRPTWSKSSLEAEVPEGGRMGGGSSLGLVNGHMA